MAEKQSNSSQSLISFLIVAIIAVVDIIIGTVIIKQLANTNRLISKIIAAITRTVARPRRLQVLFELAAQFS